MLTRVKNCNNFQPQFLRVLHYVCDKQGVTENALQRKLQFLINNSKYHYKVFFLTTGILTTRYDSNRKRMFYYRPKRRGQWRSNGVCNAHGPSAVGPKIYQTLFFQDESPESADNRFRVNTFLATIDRACTQIKEPFLSINSVAMTFGILSPSILLSASGDELYARAESLAKQLVGYDTDISSAFPNQLSFRSCFHSQLSTKSTILEVARLLLIDYHAFSSTFNDICTAYMLLLTLPVTVATCQRSFSKLKLTTSFTSLPSKYYVSGASQ